MQYACEASRNKKETTCFKSRRRTTLGAFLLLLMPLAVWVSGWKWQPGQSGHLLRVLFWITETVTSPWGTLTSLILSGWFLWCLRFRLRPAILLLIIMNGAILAGQGRKTWVKDQVQEPRPFVVWLEHSHGVNEQQFYQLKRQQRGEMVSALLANDTKLPAWLKKHWPKETGFAFPSGHTMFAASWALLGDWAAMAAPACCHGGGAILLSGRRGSWAAVCCWACTGRAIWWSRR